MTQTLHDTMLRDAQYYVHDVSPALEATVCSMTAASFRASVFLDRRIVLPEGAAITHMPIGAFCGKFPALAETATGYLFHISHVGSTLLSRLLGCKPTVLALREPALLRWMTAFKESLGCPECGVDAATYQTYLATSLGLLARPLITESVTADRVVIKPSSYHNILAEDILVQQPKARVVGLYSRLEAFTGTVLHGGGWQDMQTHGPRRLKRLQNMLGSAPWRLTDLSPGEHIAMSWLAEMSTLQRASVTAGLRWRWLDFDAYLNDPAPHFAALCDGLNLAWTEADTTAVDRSGLREVYAKDSTIHYNAATRQARAADVRARHSDEFTKARRWLERAKADHPALSALAPMC